MALLMTTRTKRLLCQFSLLLAGLCALTSRGVAGESVSQQPPPSQQFAVLKQNVTGEVLCCLAPPVLSTTVRSMLECAARCTQFSASCTHFNVLQTSAAVRGVLCQLFLGLPTCFGPLPGCTHYAADPVGPFSFKNLYVI